ncbi:MAG: hypothetical protein O7F08_07745 [Deltaproteobacteria bacterium]|nr:hypothetical protein [Deltaproteobacteria bacterium]
MLRFRVLLGWSAVLLATLITASSAHGSIVQALDLSELVAQSDRIVVGRVVLAEVFQRGDGSITTWYRVEVERELRSDAPTRDEEPEVIVQVLGGQIGDLGMRVEGEPRFSVGERAVIFMREGNQLAFRPVGMAQGVMRIRMDEGAETVFQSREGLLLVRRGPDGLLKRSPGALPRKERLDAFLDRVSTIVRQQGGATHE